MAVGLCTIHPDHNHGLVTSPGAGARGAQDLLQLFSKVLTGDTVEGKIEWTGEAHEGVGEYNNNVGCISIIIRRVHRLMKRLINSIPSFVYVNYLFSDGIQHCDHHQRELSDQEDGDDDG